MKLNWKKFSVAAVAGALLLTAAAAVAFSHAHGRHQGPPQGEGRRGPGHRDGLGPLRDLNLTDDQKAQIKKINESFEAGNKALFDQLRTLHESEPDPMSGTFDEAAVRAAAEARSKVQVELEVSHAKMMSQIAGVLTAEQKTQLAARRQQFERQGPPPRPGEPNAVTRLGTIDASAITCAKRPAEREGRAPGNTRLFLLSRSLFLRENILLHKTSHSTHSLFTSPNAGPAS